MIYSEYISIYVWTWPETQLQMNANVAPHLLDVQITGQWRVFQLVPLTSKCPKKSLKAASSGLSSGSTF